MTLTPYAERLAEELSVPFLTTRVCRGWESNPTFRLRGERSNLLRHRRGFQTCLMTKLIMAAHIVKEQTAHPEGKYFQELKQPIGQYEENGHHWQVSSSTACDI